MRYELFCSLLLVSGKQKRALAVAKQQQTAISGSINFPPLRLFPLFSAKNHNWRFRCYAGNKTSHRLLYLGLSQLMLILNFPPKTENMS